MVEERMVEYVRRYIDERDPIGTKLKRRFPFRLLAEHGRRCAVWAERICAAEGGDAEIAGIAALFHDIGKCVDSTQEGHAAEGARICAEYLAGIGFDREKSARIVEIVRNHIHHENPPTLEARIESDADLLDEVGALTVLWDAMATGAEDEQSYEIAYERIRKVYEKLSSPDLTAYHTATAKRFIAERVAFLGEFVKNLEWELGITDLGKARGT